MRKILAFMMVTVDGYHADTAGTTGWHTVDAEFGEFAAEQLDEADTLLFGRVTYEMMAAYWPTPEATERDPEVAGRMNSTPKIVVSRTLGTAGWSGTRLVRDTGELARLKGEPGGDIMILGSSALTVSLLEAGLVDELRIMVSPLALGAGQSAFRNEAGPTSLELLEARAFKSGNVLLSYRPAG
ncbi:dihydrofolate reductase family protein [Actinomadura craniellae]|nr:dihydrofolate reductase family protein [Actinomadura craniellae]